MKSENIDISALRCAPLSFVEAPQQDDPQSVFDRVARHLLTQGAQSTDGDTCLYRSGEMRCAVGILIPDGAYKLAMEGCDVEYVAMLPGMPAAICMNVPLLMLLQHIHDETPVIQWPDALRDAAKLYNLSDAILATTPLSPAQR